MEGIKYYRGRQFTVLPSMQCEQFPKGWAGVKRWNSFYQHFARCDRDWRAGASNGEIRSTNISPGAVATELTSTITPGDTASFVDPLCSIAIDADAIARAIAYAIERPGDVDVNEIIIRPTGEEFWSRAITWESIDSQSNTARRLN